MDPKISILLTTRNQAHSLWRTILSALAQSEERWELLVIDRGSCDSTPELMKEFGDPRIRFFRCGEVGRAEARNEGLRKARGEYIVYLEPDAGWDASFLRRMLARAESDPHGLLWYCGEMLFYYEPGSGGERLLCDTEARPHHRYSVGDVAAFQYPPAHTWFHRKVLVDLIGGWDTATPWFEDWDFFLRALTHQAAYMHWVDETLSEQRLPAPGVRGLVSTSPLKDRYRQLVGQKYLKRKWDKHPALQAGRVEWN